MLIDVADLIKNCWGGSINDKEGAIAVVKKIQVKIEKCKILKKENKVDKSRGGWLTNTWLDEKAT